MRVLIDTNIIIDELLNRYPFDNVSNYVFFHSASKTCNMCLCANQITDVFYIVRKYTHSRDKSIDIINNLVKLFEPLDTLKEDCIVAMSSNVLDYEDAVLESIAYRNNCDFIITRDSKDFVNSKVKAINPNDFIKMIES